LEFRRVLFRSGRQEYLKLLLNQQNPEKFSRTLTYYDYLNTARFEQVERFNETLRQLANVEAGIESQQTILAEKQDGLKQRRAQLAEARKARQLTLAKLDKDLSRRSQAPGSQAGAGAVRARAQDHRGNPRPPGPRSRAGTSACAGTGARGTLTPGKRQYGVRPACFQRRRQLRRA